MTGFDMEGLGEQVKQNCNISDARYWGNYSICGLLLALRGLFRHEKKIPLWKETPHRAVSEWIASREKLWHQVEDDDFLALSIAGKEYDPFDATGINGCLAPHDMIYGAGLGVYGKPSFFLAELLSKDSFDGYEVVASGRELVRDLAAYPAMLQDSTIFVRREALTTLFWDKLEEIRLHKHRGALLYAFQQYGITPEEAVSESLYNRVRQIADEESEVFVRHEIGEGVEGRILGERWRKLLSSPLNRRVETYVRSVKDVLSDTSEKGMLKYIIEHKKGGALGFYLSFMGGFRSAIFPEIGRIFPDFAEREDWPGVERARRKGYQRAAGLAEKVLDIFRLQGHGAGEVIERELIGNGPKERP